MLEAEQDPNRRKEKQPCFANSSLRCLQDLFGLRVQGMEYHGLRATAQVLFGAIYYILSGRNVLAM